MKHIKQKQIAVFFVTTLSIGCTNNENPIANKNEKQLELEIIPANQVLITWDSTIYQHTTYWQTYLDTTDYDSLAISLLNSTLIIEDLWCPNVNTACTIPIRGGSEVIIKLNKPDTLVLSYGFQSNDGSFPIICFDSWRHYKYTYK